MLACVSAERVERDHDDAELLVAIGAGDDGEALRTLYRRYAPRVYGLGVQLLGDRGLAEELVQETFVRIWRSAGRYDPGRGAPATFLFTVARRLAVDIWRRQSSRTAVTGMPPAPDDDRIDAALRRLEVRDALTSLTPAHRQVLELTYFQGLKQRQVAERLAIPVGTVKTRTHHALRALKVSLQERGFDV
jgi:RNA polymerase sigma-70 factor, ECF subfamily